LLLPAARDLRRGRGQHDRQRLLQGGLQGAAHGVRGGGAEASVREPGRERRVTPEPSPPPAAPGGALALVVLSALILFLEMLLVRWVGTELRIFAYLQNGVLVATFLGLGLGCWQAARPARLLPGATALALVCFAIADPFGWQIGETLTQGLTVFQ